MEGYDTFEFDLPNALLDQLVDFIDRLTSALLIRPVVDRIPDAQGVYELFHRGQLVYVGKTDAEAGLRRRLGRHALKVLHRRGLEPTDVSFKAVRVFVFTAMDLETQLKRHYEAAGMEPGWNGGGFGANDPGRQRETTNRDPAGFDHQFPIEIDLPVVRLPSGIRSVAGVLGELKNALPYTFRYETERTASGRARRGQPHVDLVSASVEISAEMTTTRSVLRAVLDALPHGWQATYFPSHVILYKETRGYNHGTRI